MTAMNFFGCALTAFGPALAFFWFVICRDPIRVIIVIASAFFWLLATLISSAWWLAVIPLKEQLAFGLIFSVIFQEVFRFGFYKLMRKAEAGLQMVSEDEMYKDHNIAKARHVLALVSGFGYGLCSGAFALVNVLALAWGPGTLGLYGNGSNMFFLTSAYLTFCTIFLNTFWNVVFFYALDSRKFNLVLLVVLTHLATSSLTLLNSHRYYLASLLPITIILVAVVATAFAITGGTLRNWRTLLMFKHPRESNPLPVPSSSDTTAIST